MKASDLLICIGVALNAPNHYWLGFTVALFCLWALAANRVAYHERALREFEESED